MLFSLVQTPSKFVQPLLTDVGGSVLSLLGSYLMLFSHIESIIYEPVDNFERRTANERLIISDDFHSSNG